MVNFKIRVYPVGLPEKSNIIMIMINIPRQRNWKADEKVNLKSRKLFFPKGLTTLGKTDRFIKVSKNKRHTEPGQLKSLKAKLKHSLSRY